MKIMALGDSHYCGTPCGRCGVNPNPRCNRLTSDVVRAFLDQDCEREGWMNTYLKFERSLVGHETTPEESRDIWDSLIFYNYLQVALGGPRVAGSPGQYDAGSVPFFSVLDRFRPDVLAVWGVRLWNSLPSERWTDGPEVVIDGYRVNNGWYGLANGAKARVVCVYHPSSAYDWSYWHRVLQTCGCPAEK